MNTTRFLSDFNRIFGAGYVRRAYDCLDIEAQITVESGNQLSAAANRFAAPDYSEASPTRISDTTEIDHD